MPRLCIGLLTHCNDEKDPERFEVLKKSVDSLASLKSEETYIYVWDNGSSEAVRNFLNQKNFFDARYYSDNNLYDLVAVHKLAKLSEEIGADYVCHLEDDFLFYENNFVSACCDFLDKNHDCGYLRILKYDCEKKHIFDKFAGHPDLDKANCQRHFNQISKQQLEWKKSDNIAGLSFYKNNWHWYNYANICRADVFRKIIPYEDHKPLQRLEGYMMKKYHELGLKTGVLDKGVVTHLGNFNIKTSQRIKLVNQNATHDLPVLEYEKIKKEIKDCGV